MEILIFLHIFIVVCMFIIGTLFGSFLSLATYRIPRHEDIVATRSYCPTCKHKLGFFDLIPVFSYIIIGGKCKYCKEKISPRYFLLETLNGIVFVVFYLLFGYTLKMAAVAIIYVLIILAIGSCIMKSKMTDEEKNKVKAKVEEKKSAKKLSKKSGVFISELVAAFFLFITLMVTAFTIARNSNAKTRENLLRADANFIAVQNLEYCLATDYKALNSYQIEQEKNDTVYNVVVDITKLSDQDYLKDDIVKRVDVKVTYTVDGNIKESKISTLKGDA